MRSRRGWVAVLLSSVLAATPAWGLEYLAAVGEDHPDGDPGAANARWVRVSGSDIVSDISTFTDLLVSRDGGRTWETVFENDSKIINWVGANGSNVLGTVTIPVGTYTLARDRASSEVVTANVNDGTNATVQVAIDTEAGQTPAFIEDVVNFSVERDGSATLRFDDPIIRVDALIRWIGSTYEVLDVENDLTQSELGGSKFSTQ